jgi:hypothetical protein
MKNLVINLYTFNKFIVLCKGAKKYFVVLFLGVGIYLGHLDADLTIVYVRYIEWFVIYVQFSEFRKEKTPIF